ncbi:MAG: Centromere-binding protein ParB C-terminal [Actinomycetota bacterium]|jgi:hypothetical protein|nr:Centromere-binding protein ParB C-terminal [Actinomycetota bacterium]
MAYRQRCSVTDGRGRRANFSTQVAETIQDRARAAVAGVSAATGSEYSLAALTEDALEQFCRHLEEVYNDGSPWPTKAPRLRPGRRVG